MAVSKAVYDRDATLRRLRGNESLLKDVARFFHEDAPQLVTALERAAQTHDSSSIARAAHSICGLAATFGAREVVEAANHVESVSSSDELPELPAAVEALKDAVARLDEALASERVD